MANLSKTTRDHEEIRRWAEERGGKPAHVKATGSGDDIGILRIDFPGYSGEGSLEPISWEQFFEKFDDQGLSLLYQEETAAGERSNFNKLVSAETAAENEERSGGGRSRGKKSASKKSASSKKSATKKSSSNRAALKRSSSGRSKKATKKAAKKSSGKKTALKRAASKKTSSKKASSKKASSKRAGLKRATRQKTTGKKASSSNRRRSINGVCGPLHPENFPLRRSPPAQLV